MRGKIARGFMRGRSAHFARRALVLAGALFVPVSAAAQDSSGIEIWSWSLAKERGFGDMIAALPPPLVAFGGAAPIDGKSVIAIDLAGTKSQAGFELAMLHGMGSLSGGGASATSGKTACEGSGETPEQAMRLEDETPDAAEAAIFCARRLHPDAAWQSALLARDGSRYYSVIQLRWPDGTLRLVYADLTEWAEANGL